MGWGRDRLHTSAGTNRLQSSISMMEAQCWRLEPHLPSRAGRTARGGIRPPEIVAICAQSGIRMG
jgi:hypothetical protein